MRQHVFIIGSKGIPARYGGYESFLERLTQYQKSNNIKYQVACLKSSKEYEQKTFQHNGAECFNIKQMNIGPAKAIAYDVQAMQYCLHYIKKHKIEQPVIYVLACRIGPFFGYFRKQVEQLDGKLYINPDGHEWKRDKWSWPVKKYWKISERLMVKHAHLVICDSKNIEKYIQKSYAKYQPKTTYIAYGSETIPSVLGDNDKKIENWYKEKGVRPGEYYMVVGRFVPENNYETMIREFMLSKTKKDFIIITKIDNQKFYKKLLERTGFNKDERIKFVGTVYDQELLKKLRENAFAYLHGHEVGGTNPSLLEALGSTELNLLLDVGFNREVGEDSALYWSKSNRSLCNIMETAEILDDSERKKLSDKAKKRIREVYSWDYIVQQYEHLFTSGGEE
ncbi:MAG: DUF1972 domain-containing protein [Muricomes sp.]